MRGDNTESTLAVSMERIAEKVDEILTRMKRAKIVLVGDFTCPPKLKSSGGIEIGRQLGLALQKKGIQLSEQGAYTQIYGRFKVVKRRQHGDDDFESHALDVELEFLDEDDNELFFQELKVGQKVNKIGQTIFGNEVLQIAGVSLDVPPNVNEKERQKQIGQQIKTPPTKVQGTQVSNGSPYGVEVLVNSDGNISTRQPTLDAGNRAFVPLHEGEEYMVRVYNHADHEIAVSMRIDGVNMFVDAVDNKNNQRFLVRPGKFATIPGWYLHNGQETVHDAQGAVVPPTKAFLITGYENSVAKRVGSNIGIGTISVEIRAAWDPNGTPPADEPRGGTKGAATGQGRDIDQKYKTLPRQISKHVRSIINVRYTK